MRPESTSASVFSSDYTTSRNDGVINLDGYVSASAVEDRIEGAENAARDLPFLHIDLSYAVHFDVVGLLRLLSLVAERRALDRRTMFRLPNDNLARHILRLWDFPKAVSAVARVPFRFLVERNDWEHFGEDWPVPHVRTQPTSSQDSVLAYLVERRSFGLTPYRKGGNPGLERLIQDQTAHWSNYALASLLSALLPKPTADFARVVVREMLANALHNASPSIVVAGSQLDLIPHAETGAPAGLTIAVWHDGATTVDRLAAAAEATCEHGGKTATGGSADVDAGLLALYRTAGVTIGGVVVARDETRRLVVERHADGGYSTRSASGLTPMFGGLVIVRLPIANA